MSVLAILLANAAVMGQHMSRVVTATVVERPLPATMALIAVPFASIGDAPVRVFVAAGAMGLVFNPLGRLAYTTTP